MTPPPGTQGDVSHRLAGLAAVQSEQLFRAIFEQAAVGIALIETPTGRFLRVNQRYGEIVGLSRDEMTATTFMAITHPDDLQADLSNMEELKAGRIRDFAMEKRYFQSNGSIVWVDLTVSPLWETGEAPSFHIAVVQDITGRKQAEQNLTNLNDTLEQQVAQRTCELEESRRRLNAIVEGTSDAVFLKDGEGRYLLCNAAAGRFVGKLPHEVLGQNDSALFPVEEAHTIREDDRRIMADRKTVTHEETITTADGVRRTFLSTKGPLFDAPGHVIGIFGISRDITDRTRIEQALRASEERLQLAQEAGKIGTFDWDIVSGRVTWSPQLERIWGLPVGGYGGTYADWARQVHPGDRAEAERLAQRVLVDPAYPYVFEHRIIHPNGTERWVAAHAMIVRDETGRAVRMVGINIDITERKHAEAQLRESEERLNQAIHLAKIGIFDHDHRTETLYWSPMMREIYGVPTDEPASLDGYIQLLHSDDRDAIVAAVRQAHDPTGDGLYRVEHRLMRRDGTVRWVSLQSHTLFEGEGPTRKPIRTMGAMVDITERKEAEEVLGQLNETLEQRVAERTEALRASEVFNREILDSLSANVAVLDASGVIVAVNRVWERAALLNDPLGGAQVGVGANYVKVCERAADSSPKMRRTLEGILDVLAGRKQEFEDEYLCARPDGQQQWFNMRVTPLNDRGGCVIVHEDVTIRKRAESVLQDSYHRLQVLSREVQLAEERERSRLSRELHDEFGQLLSALKLDLGRMINDATKQPALSQPILGRKLAEASKVVDRLFSSLRELIRGLRPAVLEELGLVPALEALVSDFEERLGLCCQLAVDDQDGGLSITLEAEGALYRIAQELLTNVGRHAAAKNVTVRLHVEGGAICLTVKDDGRGMSKVQRQGKNRFGLRGIRERVELLGGQVKIRSGRSEGSTVTVTVPGELLNGNKGSSRSAHSLASAMPRRPRHERQM